MIASLSGILSEKQPNEITVNVGGVGYRVFISLQSFAKLPAAGEKVACLIHTAVREDDISLYGFLDEREKRLFQKLITVSGIGPKLALTVLSGIPYDDLITALGAENLARLTTIPGIGKKTAERMIVDLKDKLTGLRTEGVGPSGKKKAYEDILSALLNLGYNRPIAERTLNRMTVAEGVSLESLVKEALKILAESRA